MKTLNFGLCLVFIFALYGFNSPGCGEKDTDSHDVSSETTYRITYAVESYCPESRANVSYQDLYGIKNMSNARLPWFFAFDAPKKTHLYLSISNPDFSSDPNSPFCNMSFLQIFILKDGDILKSCIKNNDYYIGDYKGDPNHSLTIESSL